MTRSQLPPKSFHVHPQRFRQRVMLTDGSQIEWSCLCPKNDVLTLIQDSIIHPSWNSTRLNHQLLLLDSFGSVSKFHKKFISAKNQDIPNGSNSSGGGTTAQTGMPDATQQFSASDVWRTLESTFAALDERSKSGRVGRLEREAMVDPDEERKLAAIAASAQKKKSTKKK